MSRFCTDCGTPCEPGTRFCITCGVAISPTEQVAGTRAAEAPVIPTATVTVPEHHPAAAPRRSKAPIVAAVLLALTAGGGAFWFVGHRNASPDPDLSTSASQSRIPSPDSTAPSPRPESEPETSDDPNAVLGLTDQQAVAELDAASREGQADLRRVAGRWVTQLSSKCVGMATPYIDLGIKQSDGWSYVPDGNFDDVTLTPQNIAAFHRAMRDEFGAATVRYRDLSSRQRIEGCADPRAWVSFIPRVRTGANAALAACDRLGLPPNDCFAARYPLGGNGRIEQKTSI